MEGREVIVYEGRISSWLNGLLIGALVGAVLALLFTPQSGRENRQVIEEKTNQVRDQAVKLVDETRSRASEVIQRARGQMERSQELREENAILEEGVERTYDL